MSNINEKMKKEINSLTKDTTNLTNLGLYLAQYRNDNALNILNWLIIAIQNKWIEKEIDFNKQKKHATIASRLIENPIYISKEIFDFVSKTNKIDFNFRPHKTYSIKELMAKITVDINNPESSFFKEEALAKKTLETLSYFANNSTMNINTTMASFLLKALNEENISLELKEIITQILHTKRTPHIKYDDKIKENLKYQKKILLEEKQIKLLTEKDYLYFKKALYPKLEKKEIKL